jgi:leucyl-tRNA synthetase
MSKSKGNVVDPEVMIKKYGADTMRLFILFAAPPELDLEWSDQGVEGAWRFLNRAWNLADKAAAAGAVPAGAAVEAAEREFRRRLHGTIAQVTRDVAENFQFNTAIARMMEFANHLSAALESKLVSGETLREGVKTLVRLLAPFCPHIAEELWARGGEKPSVFDAAWPVHDPACLVEDQVEIVIQVNGKIKSRLTVSPETGEEALKAAACADPNIAALLAGRPHAKIIVIPGRLVNIVMR